MHEKAITFVLVHKNNTDKQKTEEALHDGMMPNKQCQAVNTANTSSVFMFHIQTTSCILVGTATFADNDHVYIMLTSLKLPT